MDCINDVALIYADFGNLDLMHVKCTIIKHLKNVLTDRMAVNHCVVEYLKSKLDINLLELKCNVHPLDGIANKCTSTLKDYDVLLKCISSDTFGYNCCAVNFVYGMTKMRFKQGKGDPSGFKQFMCQENIKSALFVRYVGNRFSILLVLCLLIRKS